MGWLDKIIGIPDPGKAVEAVGGVLDELFTSKEEKLSHDEIMERIKQNPQKAQWKINQIEAGHRTVWVAGWRPAIGWVAAISLFFFYVPQYVVSTYIWVKAIAMAGWVTPLPAYPTSADGVLELVGAMLGIAILRSAEKARGLTK